MITKSSCHTYLKNSKPYIFILQKVKKPPDGFLTHIFFASAIILIFGGLFLHSLSRKLKVNLNWLRVPTTEFSKQKCITRRDNPKSIKIIWKARKKPPKGHTKNKPFVLCTISKDRIFHILFSIVEYSEQVGFDSNGS